MKKGETRQRAKLFEDGTANSSLYVRAKDYDELYAERDTLESEVARMIGANEHYHETMQKLAERVVGLETALGSVSEEISLNGCDGPHEDICAETDRPQEDWCCWCRMGLAVNSVRATPSGHSPQ